MTDEDYDNIIDELEEENADLKAKLAEAMKALNDIARQKKTDELETEYDVEVADFEGGYDMCIDLARTTLAELTGGKNE